LRPLVHPSEFRLDDVAGAHQVIESGSATGKVVITVA
jgi:NADPH:quinone reductase-like Zn-dependent oxidoreductase